jgi:hypothetical protein
LAVGNFIQTVTQKVEFLANLNQNTDRLRLIFQGGDLNSRFFFLFVKKIKNCCILHNTIKENYNFKISSFQNKKGGKL